MQHRRTRNRRVCQANDRKPMSVSFKISDFGTAGNFSTLDRPRGTWTKRAPEVLWCLEADTGTDVFSWYRTLQADASPPEIPRATIPLSVSAGEYRATDIVTCDDCAPKALLDQTKLVPYRHTDKEFYGIDIVRLAPGRIQPYVWYASKASLSAASSCGGRGAVKGKA
ncbi:hypothetical protein Q5P01_010537 [Channa striata]|uniref:Uncharacterized protein n=1 Tax=Channa striata TaxID=64152 RepID=A0AA88SQN3_CHASR|nr:hypothetical protein Q5P01_010537 [Channa striata]